jgi:hypothetical protein
VQADVKDFVDLGTSKPKNATAVSAEVAVNEAVNNCSPLKAT